MGLNAGGQITERDREVLGLLAEHRVMVTPQISHALGVADSTAAARLRRLQELRLVSYDRIFERTAPAVSITRRGLNAIESRLAPPKLDLKGYRHDIGVGWLWLAARDGAFGRPARLVSEREMRSHDLRSDRRAEPFGVALGGLDSYGRQTRHYPDLTVTTESGKRLDIELELTAKSARRLDTIMRGYAGDGRVDGVLYLVPNRALERLITDAARRAGIPDLIRVQRLAGGLIEGSPPERGAKGRQRGESGRQRDAAVSAGRGHGGPRQAGQERGG